MTAIDAATKLRIRDALLAQARAALEATQRHVGEEHATAEGDQGEVTTEDDVSQAYEAGDLHALFERSADGQQAVVGAIEALDMAPTDTVRAGAVVAYGGDHFVVGVPAAPFEVDGTTYEGISADSPVHAAIAGKAAGDTFEVNGTTHTLDVVA
jgi:transcription elongation GreA/GreB family factor